MFDGFLDKKHGFSPNAEEIDVHMYIVQHPMFNCSIVHF